MLFFRTELFNLTDVQVCARIVRLDGAGASVLSADRQKTTKCIERQHRV